MLFSLRMWDNQSGRQFFQSIFRYYGFHVYLWTKKSVLYPLTYIKVIKPSTLYKNIFDLYVEALKSDHNDFVLQFLNINSMI